MSNLTQTTTTRTQNAPVRWTIDPTHSSVEFAVKHLMISTVRGRFKDVAGAIVFDPAAPDGASIEARIAVASVETGAADRDNHLRSGDFFDAENHPELTFVSRRVEPKGDDRFAVVGDLTIRGVTREVTLDVEREGEAIDPWGGRRTAATATTRVNRKDFGLTWNQTLETGGFLVGDDIRITLHVQAVADKEDA